MNIKRILIFNFLDFKYNMDLKDGFDTIITEILYYLLIYIYFMIH